MKKLKKKKIIIVSLYTTLVLGTIGLTLYPETNSRFIKNSKEDTILSYRSQLENLYGGKITYDTAGSDATTAKLSFTFNRNDLIRDITTSENKDVYTIDVPNGCRIESSTSSGIKETIEGSENIRYTFISPGDDGTQAIIIRAACDVDTIAPEKTDPFKIGFKVYEKYGSEDEFLYKDFIYDAGTKEDYLKDKVSDLVVEQTELTFKATGSRQDIYIKFKEWVQSYSRKDYKDEVVKYLSLSSVLPNYDSDITKFFNFVETEDPNVLKGLLLAKKSFPCSETECTVEFKLDDNFLGYARTKDEQSDLKILYFSSNDNEQLKSALNYYLTTRVYPNGAEFRERVYNYIVNYSDGNLVEVIAKGIPGVGSTLLNPAIAKPNGILLKNDLESIMDKYENQSDKIEIKRIYNSLGHIDNYLTEKDFMESLKLSKTVSSKIKSEISVTETTIYLPMFKEAIDTFAATTTKFVKYYIYDNSEYDTNGTMIGDKQYLIIRIESKGNQAFADLSTINVKSDEYALISDKIKNEISPTSTVYKALYTESIYKYSDSLANGTNEPFENYYVYDNSKYDESGNLVGDKQYLYVRFAFDGTKVKIDLEVTKNVLKAMAAVNVTTNGVNNTIIAFAYENLQDIVEPANHLKEYFKKWGINTESLQTTHNAEKKILQITIDKSNRIVSDTETTKTSNDAEKLNTDIKEIPKSEIIDTMKVEIPNSEIFENVMEKKPVNLNVEESSVYLEDVEKIKNNIELANFYEVNIKEQDYIEEAEVTEENYTTT